MENITERNTNTGIQEAMAEEHPFTDKEWNEAIGKSNNSSSINYNHSARSIARARGYSRVTPEHLMET